MPYWKMPYNMLPTVLFIVGARPNFIKLAPLCAAAKNNSHLQIKIVHTGQHYDELMSDIFFKDLEIPAPDFFLNVGSDTHARQTARMMLALENLCEQHCFAALIVIGDVNSTLAGALVGAKLNIPVVHIEAGLRSYNREMPEEINRIATDHISDLLFAPTNAAMENLKSEGLGKRSFFSGDVMYDMALKGLELSKKNINGSQQADYYLSTLHRPYNVDHPKQLDQIIRALSCLDKKVILAAHPRLQKNLKKYRIKTGKNIELTKPVGYLEFLTLEKNAVKIITDSGGVQKEAYYVKTPCITLRPETEWVETIRTGANLLVPERKKTDIIEAVSQNTEPDYSAKPYGDGHASEKILQQITQQILN